MRDEYLISWTWLPAYTQIMKKCPIHTRYLYTHQCLIQMTYLYACQCLPAYTQINTYDSIINMTWSICGYVIRLLYISSRNFLKFWVFVVEKSCLARSLLQQKELISGARLCLCTSKHIHICVYLCVQRYNIHVCIYLCIYIYINVYTHMCMYIYVYRYIYIHVRICINIYIFIHMCTFMFTYICIRKYVYICTYIYINLYIHINIYTSIYLYTFIYV